MVSKACPTPSWSRTSKTATSKTKKSTCRGQLSVHSQHEAFWARYLWEIQDHAERARVRPHAARTFCYHPRMDVCATRPSRCTLCITATLQPHSPRAHEGLNESRSHQGPLRLLIMTTMPTMRSGLVPLHPEGLPISTRARTERVSKATRKRHLLSKPHKVTIGDRAMQKVGVKPKTYSDHHIGSLAVHNIIECSTNHFNTAGVIPE